MYVALSNQDSTQLDKLEKTAWVLMRLMVDPSTDQSPGAVLVSSANTTVGPSYYSWSGDTTHTTTISRVRSHYVDLSAVTMGVILMIMDLEDTQLYFMMSSNCNMGIKAWGLYSMALGFK